MPKKKSPGSPSGCYRNPPEHTRFRKGQSGNPRGRPKGSRNFRTLIEQELDEQIEVNENGKVVRLSKRSIIAKKLVNEAATGNSRAWRELLPMISGKSEADTVEIDPVTSAMIASYLARYHRPDEPSQDEPGEGGTKRRNASGRS
jgi:hypothetical protein